MKGTITDFLELVSTKPELSRELIELAARHGFEFSADELSDSELQGVVGGTDDSRLGMIWKDGIHRHSQDLQIIINVLRESNDSLKATIDNMSG